MKDSVGHEWSLGFDAFDRSSEVAYCLDSISNGSILYNKVDPAQIITGVAVDNSAEKAKIKGIEEAFKRESAKMKHEISKETARGWHFRVKDRVLKF